MPRRPPFAGGDYPMAFPPQRTSFDPEAFDDLVRNHGVVFVHYRSMPCPVGLVDPDDATRRSHEHHQNCSNGYVYTRSGEFTAAFLSNSSDFKLIEPGLLDGSSVTISIPRFYDDAEDKRVQVSNFDRLYLKEAAVPVDTSHLFAAHITGRDRLLFPVVDVVDLMDSRGISYHQGADFDVADGQIVWRQGRTPGVDPATGRGTVCSVRYTFHPHWYVKYLPHEIRVAQTEDPDTGERAIENMPQQAIIQREYAFAKEQHDERARQDRRLSGQEPGPPSGAFGPR